MLLDFLEAYIWVRDVGKGPMRENHYHGITTGLIAGHDELIREFSSNQEAGNGYPDITFLSANRRTAVIMELKQIQNQAVIYTMADEALMQIKQKKYATKFRENPLIEKIYCYGICFCKKNCAVSFDQIIH
ncbi:MAG: PD-(D/E)XK nuclease domain-containing protein [Succinatimonas sp.]|nr:PD-(D/E)XK nuclease domain-containing protein [Succinatimonas sp.]